MIRAAAAADIAAQIVACIGQQCDYKIVYARSLPPAECDTIALVWGPRSFAAESACGVTACDGTEVTPLLVTITKCCIGPDGADAFDLAAEEREAICFSADLEAIEDCFRCADWRQFAADHAVDRIRVISTTPGTVRGGCMDATIRVEFTATVCCP